MAAVVQHNLLDQMVLLLIVNRMVREIVLSELTIAYHAMGIVNETLWCL